MREGNPTRETELRVSRPVMDPADTKLGEIKRMRQARNDSRAADHIHSATSESNPFLTAFSHLPSDPAVRE